MQDEGSLDSGVVSLQAKLLNKLIRHFCYRLAFHHQTSTEKVAQDLIQITQPLSRSNPLLSDSQPTSAGWIR